MPIILFALFVCVPLIEIALFIQVGGAIGLWSTIAIVIVTAVIGTALVQKQGLSTLQRGQSDMKAGRVPVSAMRDGAFIFMAGALLLTPGFLTDAVGFSLLVPPFRKWIARKIMGKVMKSSHIHVNVDGFQSGPAPSGASRNPGSSSDSQTIDGTYSHVENPDPTGNRRPHAPNDAKSEARPNNQSAPQSGSKDSPWRQ